jgi:hypothetical protein
MKSTPMDAQCAIFAGFGRNAIFVATDGQKESPVGSLLTTPAGLGDSAKLHVAWGHNNGGFRSVLRSGQ